MREVTVTYLFVPKPLKKNILSKDTGTYTVQANLIRPLIIGRHVSFTKEGGDSYPVNDFSRTSSIFANSTHFMCNFPINIYGLFLLYAYVSLI